MNDNLQLLLCGVNAKTDICVFVDKENKELYTFLGLALLERVPEDRESLLNKLLVARLANYGIPLSRLASAFHHDHRTIAKWAVAILTGDFDLIASAFSGRGPAGKLTGEMLAFIKGQYFALREHAYSYRKKILRELKRRYKVELSEGFLSRLFASFNDEESNGDASQTSTENGTGGDYANNPASPETTEVMAQEPNSASISITTGVSEKFTENVNPETGAGTFEKVDSRMDRAQDADDSGSNLPLAVTYSPVLTTVSAGNNEVALDSDCSSLPLRTLPVSGVAVPDNPKLLHHAGALIMSPWFDLFRSSAAPETPGTSELDQFVAQILQGAVNVEQSKTLKMEDLALLCGKMVKSCRWQREKLSNSACPELVDDILRRATGLAFPGETESDIVFFDPHGKPYTGELKTLKGWCGKTHRTRKMMYLDFAHTAAGRPCFISYADNYYDMRERFLFMLPRFDSIFSPCAGRTWVIDRGIFGLATFRAVMDYGNHLITWEKNYKKDGWADSRTAVIFRRCRMRNHSHDLRAWHFACQESEWSRMTGVRKIIVRVTDPDGKESEVSVLCTNPDMPLELVVELIFNRWMMQENSFMRMDNHFGIQQITSYDFSSYVEIAGELNDKTVETREFHELKKELRKLEKELGNKLRILDNCKDKLENERKSIASLESVANQDAEAGRKLSVSKRKTKNLQAKMAKIDDEIAEIKKRLDDLNEKIDETLCDTSKLRKLSEERYQRLNTGKKEVMDALRITANNIFQSVADAFRQLYNNLRDDHVILRSLIRAPGVVHYDKSKELAVFRLWPGITLQPAQIKVIREFLKLISAVINRHFHGRAAEVDIDILDENNIDLITEY